ncbi:MAG: esterase [Armatimonadetes bacterium]|nr:esterase [Armatimonadota bacterium]
MLSPLLFILCSVPQQGGRIVSPEVHPDRTVTFRLRAPNAQRVDLSIEGSASALMVKDENGVWSFTTKAMTPDIYGYSFSVDGTATLDPNNIEVKPNLFWASNMVTVPGNPPEVWEVQNVPHGKLHRHFYRSEVVGDQRDYFVYTPPGYSASGPKLPVLVLLHGYSDTAVGWTEVGKAHVILDNLIAQKKAKPMLVVMTLGYGVPDFSNPGTAGYRKPLDFRRSYAGYRDALFKEVLPTVEKDYRVQPGKASRAIAGLSMGGSESLLVGLNALDRFAYVGSFSAGGLVQSHDANFPGLKAEEANKLKLLYVRCGTDDGLIGANRGLRDWLVGKGVKLEYGETGGGHVWMLWRRNLAEFAGRLFQ